MPPHANLKVEAQMKSCEELEPTWILPGDNTSGDAALDWAKSLKRDKDRIIALEFEQMTGKFIESCLTDSTVRLRFPPSNKNYTRMLAHKIAQHYGLKTATVPCLTDGLQGSDKSLKLQVIAALRDISQDDNSDLQDQQISQEARAPIPLSGILAVAVNRKNGPLGADGRANSRRTSQTSSAQGSSSSNNKSHAFEARPWVERSALPPYGAAEKQGHYWMTPPPPYSQGFASQQQRSYAPNGGYYGSWPPGPQIGNEYVPHTATCHMGSSQSSRFPSDWGSASSDRRLSDSSTPPLGAEDGSDYWRSSRGLAGPFPPYLQGQSGSLSQRTSSGGSYAEQQSQLQAGGYVSGGGGNEQFYGSNYPTQQPYYVNHTYQQQYPPMGVMPSGDCWGSPASYYQPQGPQSHYQSWMWGMPWQHGYYMHNGYLYHGFYPQQQYWEPSPAGYVHQYQYSQHPHPMGGPAPQPLPPTSFVSPAPPPPPSCTSGQ